MKVWMGLTLGKTAKTVSPTSPREVDATPERLIATSTPLRATSVDQQLHHVILKESKNIFSHLRRTRSAAVTRAQTLGAQYA